MRFADISEKDRPPSQLLLVTGRDAGVALFCYEKDAHGIWRFVHELGIVCCHIGRNGVTDNKEEGDGCTPSGFFPLGFAFGCKPKPVTNMHYRPVTEYSYWVDDPASLFYNSWIEKPEHRDWKSAERLSDHPDCYAYAVVIEYNTVSVSPGRGSAIFLHCGRKPTAGCIAVPETAMVNILRWLDPQKSPGILIMTD